MVRVSRLLHELILALFDGRDEPGRTDLLVRLAMLELHQAEDPTTFIPLPHEPRCRRAADIVLADPTETHDIADLARDVGTSARTLSRLFSAETQLSFKSWCQRARIASAIERLSMHPGPVGQTARGGFGLCKFPGIFACVPAGDGKDADGVRGGEVNQGCHYAGAKRRREPGSNVAQPTS